jgi:antitoxin (DNA-binding transcriptional repressor) of toxin-antitoxin stability system
MDNKLQATISVNVVGMPELRREFAQIIRDVAASETDARVAARLHEVATLVAQTAAEREAKQLVEQVVPHSARAERELQVTKTRAEIAALEARLGELTGAKR